MSTEHTTSPLRLPQQLQTQLHDYRRQVWLIKGIEALCGAALGVLLAYLIVFALDRLIETPQAVRSAMFAVAVLACALIPLYLHRWVWSHRQFDQLARLLTRRYPSLGDQLLGVIELVRDDSEQTRSRALCEAAIGQVAETAGRCNFRTAIPRPRHRMLAALTAVPLLIVLALLTLYPAASLNAWSRFARPWADTPRFTFTRLAPLSNPLIIPHGEPLELAVTLADDSDWRPARGRLAIGRQQPLHASLTDDSYRFEIASQIDPAQLDLGIGDARQRVRVEPTLRPDLTSVQVEITLPEYLQRTAPIMRDVRGGSLSIVSGSAAQFRIAANRTLAAAALDGAALATHSEVAMSQPVAIDETRTIALTWQDELGLSGKEPFVINLTALEDEAPSVWCEGLPRNKVMLDSETLQFAVRAQDDFGVKRVGITWKTAVDSSEFTPIKGQRILAAGGADQETLELAGTFCPQLLEIEPQPIEVRLFVEDYHPDRTPVYTAPYYFYVLSPEQHFVWLTEQLNKWHHQSLEVRDRELQLYQTNQQLRAMNEAELDRPETRRQIESQSAAERTNGRRLSGLLNSGDELVRQAMRNPEFGVGHLERWAEMLEILKDIAGNRMPNVADLLKQSSQAPVMLASADKPASPTVGQQQPQPTGASSPEENSDKPSQPSPPRVVDSESSQQPPSDEESPARPPGAGQNRKSGLPITTIADNSSKPPSDSEQNAAETLDDAVVAQEDLLAEFNKVADELNNILANLEGSTLVKRLKAASRKQYNIARQLGEQIPDAFGTPTKLKTAPELAAQRDQIAAAEETSVVELSHVMDDMEAYFERRRMQRFKSVLDEMREEDLIGSLRQLTDDVRTESGLPIAQAEFWSDTFDRWADNLVDPACAGQCTGCKSKGMLPPSLVLEAMQILEAEVNLREETRVAEQAREALTDEEYNERALPLRDTQQKLSDRVAVLNEKIQELPDAETDFAYEINLLHVVEEIMEEAAEILGRPDTGPVAIAAETEAIELLLRSKRINPRGGGGGGSSPGGGGGGTTNDSALALVGSGVNEREIREDRGVAQMSGEQGSQFPEEFRAGLDEYFNRLEAHAPQ